jgi:hypothetical protein
MDGFLRQVCSSSLEDTTHVIVGNKLAVERTQFPQILGLDFSWSRPCPRFRWRSHSRPNAPECPSRRSAQIGLAVPRGREYLVPPASRLLDGLLGHGAHHRALC